MAHLSTDPAAAIPDADLLEQQLVVDAELVTRARPSRPFADPPDADPADLLDQVSPVPGDDDDYPHARDPWQGRDV